MSAENGQQGCLHVKNKENRENRKEKVSDFRDGFPMTRSCRKLWKKKRNKEKLPIDPLAFFQRRFPRRSIPPHPIAEDEKEDIGPFAYPDIQSRKETGTGVFPGLRPCSGF
ncbi:hypothetical protein LFML04_1760 [Leptospirillum ferriphilum ML-04]|uniref:Uncharacterized protein n=1 Tax=Leptospirillum ferriphilum (strain ML-04) TaxID=1048260 RepID=J9ZBN3_LEPFM|nr:hypothetical protein LFML04_1760 [Leptospirillum ferriphilum ML-04]